MPVSRGVGPIVFSIIGIVILVVTVFAVVSLMRSEPPAQPLIHKGLELRKAADDPVKKARLISDLDDLVTTANNGDIKDQWDRMMQCLPTTCPDGAYFDLILVTTATYEKDLPQSALTINLIAVGKYWGDGDHLLEFSKALTMASDQVDEVQAKGARKQWQEIVDCNGNCTEKNDLIFSLIETVST